MAEIPKPPSLEGPPPFRPPGSEGGGGEYAKSYFERAGGYPIPGPDLIDELQLAEIGENGDVSELEGVIRKALAYREGLVGGPTGEIYRFDLSKISSDNETKQKIAHLQNLFTTVESSTNRPRAEYVDVAIDEAIEGKIRRAQAWRDDQEGYARKFERRLDRLDRFRAEEGKAPLAVEQRQGIIAEEVGRLGKEYAAIPKLVELKNHVHARKIFDGAFIHRMYSCEDPGKAAKLGSSDFPTYTPDGGHWIAIFRGENKGEFGRKVDGVFEEMVKFALPDEVVTRLGLEQIPAEVRKQAPVSVYAKGFENATMFAYWLDHLLKKADSRMDVVWSAWKMMLAWEVADNLGETIDNKGKWVLASPPIGNALHAYTAHLDIKRQIEYGLDASGKRSQTEKFISHSGLPMSLGKIPNTCENYFKESEIEFDDSYLGKPWMSEAIGNLIKNLPKPGDTDYDSADSLRRKYFDELRRGLPAWRDGTKTEIDGELKMVEKVKIALWDLWLYGRVSFADNNFPWFATDQASAEAKAGELPPGSVGMWYLTRSRCWGEKGGVINDIRSRPPAQELGDPDFFAGRLRNWAKVLGKTDKNMLPAENPRAWWVAGLIWYHIGGTVTKSPITTEEPLRDYRTTSRAQEISTKGEAAESRTVTLGDIFRNAKNCGFLREEDVRWIMNLLRIRLS